MLIKISQILKLVFKLLLLSKTQRIFIYTLETANMTFFSRQREL